MKTILMCATLFAVVWSATLPETDQALNPVAAEDEGKFKMKTWCFEFDNGKGLQVFVCLQSSEVKF